MNRKISKRGFTLIEILIVVAIIGLLASFVLVGLGGARSRARDARRIADLNQVQQSLELYYSKFGTYPVATAWTGATGLTGVLTSAATGLGIRAIPGDPTLSATYYYCASTGGTSYLVGAVLENNDNPALRQFENGTTFPCSFGVLPAGITGCSTKPTSGTVATSRLYCTTL